MLNPAKVYVESHREVVFSWEISKILSSLGDFTFALPVAFGWVEAEHVFSLKFCFLSLIYILL